MTVLCVSGMLLELPRPALNQMLQDEALLTKALEKALRALDKQVEPRYIYIILYEEVFIF